MMVESSEALAELRALTPGPERLQAAREALAAVYCSAVSGDTAELEQWCIQTIREEVLNDATEDERKAKL